MRSTDPVRWRCARCSHSGCHDAARSAPRVAPRWSCPAASRWTSSATSRSDGRARTLTASTASCPQYQRSRHYGREGSAIADFLARHQGAPLLIGARHGETLWNEEDRLTTRTDIPLSSRGEEQAQALSEALGNLEFDRAWASPKRRAWRTAEIALAGVKLGSPLSADARLVERDAGVLEGAVFSTLQDPACQLNPAWAAYSTEGSPVMPPGAEPWPAVLTRVQSLLEDAHREGGRTFIVGHGALLRILACVVMGLDPTHFRRLKLDNCGLIVVRFYECPPNQILAFNLPAEC